MNFSKLNPPFARKFIKTGFSKYVHEDSKIDWCVDKNALNDSQRFSKKHLWSSEFPKDNNLNFKWQICFCPFRKEKVSKCSSIFLHLNWRRLQIPVSTNVHFSVKTNTVIKEGYVQHQFGNTNRYEFLEFVERTKSKSFEIITNLIVSVKVSAQYETSNFRFEQNLLDNYSNLLEYGTFSDIILYVEQDKTEFKVHRNILACRSKVFASMFSYEMLENLTNRIVIKDFSSSVVKNLLNFIYCCKTEFIDINETWNLLEMSDKYDITDLKDHCIQYLARNLNEDNVFDILLKSITYNFLELKAAVLKYMYESKTFSDPSKYDILKNYPELIIEITTMFTCNNSE